MKRERRRYGPLVALAALVLGVLIAQIALAGGRSSGDSREIASLKTRIGKLEAQVARGATAQAAAGKRGPRGRQGPAGPAGNPGATGAQGAAPACQGNSSGDAMVAAGSVCIDKYEVSVWSSPTGGTQYGVTSDDYAAAGGCDDEGQNCTNIYARSVPGVKPSAYITYFQAQAALANVGKRLPSNAEWQQAVAGTPDPGPDNGTSDCNTNNALSTVNTGSRSSCVSNFGAFDMVGNLYEWVGDWVPLSTTCLDWDDVGTFSTGDNMCLAGADTTDDASGDGPGALIRGGNYGFGMLAGPLAVNGQTPPSGSDAIIGLRGAR